MKLLKQPEFTRILPIGIGQKVSNFEEELYNGDILRFSFIFIYKNKRKVGIFESWG